MRHTRGALVTGVQKCALPICNKTAHEHRAGDRSNRSEAERQAHTKITKAPTKYKASARHLVRALDAKIQGGGRWARSNYGNKTAHKHRAGGDRSNRREAERQAHTKIRSEARRVGKDGVGTCRSRWSPSR